MRLRLLLPRGGGAGGLGGLRRLAAATAALALALLLAACGGGDDGEGSQSSSARPAAPEPLPEGGSLAVGITEPNPAFLRPGEVAAGDDFARWRDELAAMRPSYYRLVIDWPALQPQESRPPDFGVVRDGCGRSGPPCAAWDGLRAQLAALAARQEADPGAYETLAVLDGTPEWAGRDARGCRQKAGGDHARPLSEDGAQALTGFIGEVLALAREEGAELAYWSARNEPNHPNFLFPQRSRCSEEAPSVSVSPYVEMVRSVRAALDAAPGEQRLVLGELAGLDSPSPRTTSVREFIAELPREVVCSTPVWSQHAYVGGTEAVGQARRALAEFGCERPHEIWITETGVGGALVGRQRLTGGDGAARDCRELHEQLVDWYDERQVTAAFQYTLREDDVFPVGLVDSSLEAAYPALREWQAWGSAARREPTATPPAEPSCG